MQPETSFVEAFKSNPIFFLLAGAASAVGLVLCLVALVLLTKSPKVATVVGILSALAGAGAIAMGTFGWWSARAMVAAAASSPGLTASDRARLTSYGNAEALYSLEFGLGAGALPLLGGMIAFGVGLSRRKRA